MMTERFEVLSISFRLRHVMHIVGNIFNVYKRFLLVSHFLTFLNISERFFTFMTITV